MSKSQPILYIVLPCYNEEAVLPETARRLSEKLSRLIANHQVNPKSKILFANDGSKDQTWPIIKQLHQDNSMITGICLSRNRGHQNALLAGLLTAKKHADVVISMDADLQDDIEVIDQMLQKYQDGAEIVYGVRSSRKKDSWFKRIRQKAFTNL